MFYERLEAVTSSLFCFVKMKRGRLMKKREENKEKESDSKKKMK
jgi:hypothetical protein